MGIFDRMGKVISSNINALLDKAEDPEKSLDLTVREMGSSLKSAKKEIVEALAVQKRLGKKVDELDSDVEKWEKRAELALKADDEGLAREALKHKKRIVAERDRAEAMRAEQRGVVLTMKREMERMEIKHEELEARKGTIARELKRAKEVEADPLSGGGTGGKAFDEFRRHEAKIDQSRNHADAMSEVDAALRDGLSEAELEQKFAMLEGGGYSSDGKRSDAIDDELERLKNKLRIGK